MIYYRRPLVAILYITLKLKLIVPFSDKKLEIILPWKAPANAAGKTIEFRFTAVETRTLFWTGKLANHTILVVDSSLGGNETSTTETSNNPTTASTNSTTLSPSPINSTTADCLTMDCPLVTTVMPASSSSSTQNSVLSTEKEMTSSKPLINR